MDSFTVYALAFIAIAAGACGYVIGRRERRREAEYDYPDRKDGNGTAL